MARFVLIHGGCHGGWCWERITPLLRAAGHRVAAPDLPGMGDDRTPLGEITLARWARFVADLIEAEDEPVILVGHSRAGIVISEAAELVPGRIRLLVYLAAMLLADGDTMFEAAKRSDHGRTQIAISDDGLSLSLSHDVARRGLYNRTEETWVARALDRLCPEPLAPGATPLRLTERNYGRVDRVYIGCTDDRTVVTPWFQRQMLAAVPCRRFIELETDHSPFYSMPEALAAELMALAAEVTA
jgi:pimeloyl-ACP methyl ester carboxylesterase